MLEKLDIRLLHVAAMASSLMLALALHMVHRLYPDSPGVRSWKLGSATSALGFCLVALRGQLPDLMSIVLATGLLAWGLARLLRGLREALGLKPQVAVERTAAVVAMLMCLVFTYLWPDLGARIRVVSAIYLGLSLHAASDLFGRTAARDANRWCWWALGGLMAGGVLVHTLRLSLMPPLPPEQQNYLSLRLPLEALVLLNMVLFNLTQLYVLPYVSAARQVRALREGQAVQRELLLRLGASELQLRTLVDQAPMAIAMLDREQRYIAASERWRVELAGSSAPLAGRRMGSGRDLVLTERCHHAHDLVLAGQTLHGEAEPLQIDGDAPRLFNWSASPWRDPEGQVGGTILCVEEVTARERAVAALRESDARFAAVFQSGLVGVAIGGLRDGCLLDVNDALVGLLGYRREAMIGRNGLELQLWPEAGQRDRVMALLQTEGRVPTIETRLRRADGQTVDVLFSASRVQADGQPRYVCTLSDVSALKNAQRALQARKQVLEDMVAQRTHDLALARDAAESANRAKSAFLANMSHEMRTPLNGILGMAYLLRSASSEEVQRQRLDRLEDAGRHLLRVINDVLDLSKIEAGGMVLEERAFAAAELESLVSAVIAPLAGAKGLRLEIDLAGLPPVLVGDSGRLAQALINLLSNGIKFTERGHVALQATLRYMDSRGCTLQFEVRDTGIGMSEEQLARIFKPFAQADSSMTRRYGGTGLGLAITQRLAGLMGGEVEASSRPGEGSSFRLRVHLGLPAA